MPGKLRLYTLLGCFAVLLGWSPGPASDSLQNKLLSEQLPERRVPLLIALCEQWKFSNPDSLLSTANQLSELGRQQKKTAWQCWGELYQSIYYSLNGDFRNALHLAEKNIPVTIQLANEQALQAKWYAATGNTYMKMNHYREAQGMFYSALRIAENTHNPEEQLKNTHSIGCTFMELNQYAKALEYFKKVELLLHNHSLPDNYPYLYNNLATCYSALNKPDSAYAYVRKGIAVAQRVNDAAAEASGLNILGNALARENKNKEALNIYLQAKNIREKTGDPSLIVSDLTLLAEIEARLSHTAQGISYCQQALALANEYQLKSRLPMIYTALAHNYEIAGRYKNASETYKKISELKDGLYADANPQAIADMQAKYENATQETKIKEQQFAITTRNYLIAIVMVLVLSKTWLGYVYYKRYKLRQETKLQQEVKMQQELAARAVLKAEESERQRIAQDLHDGVGQMMSVAKMNLSAVENELPNTDHKKKLANIINLIDDSCREVRTVSHNIMPNALLKSGLGAAILDFVDKVDTSMLKIEIYHEGLHERLDTNVETMLYRVIQECVNNVIKHAQANHLHISLIRDADGISATIEDNGIGFNVQNPPNGGMGLQNIRSRVQYLKGTVDFDSRPENGTLIAIHIPLEKKQH